MLSLRLRNEGLTSLATAKQCSSWATSWRNFWRRIINAWWRSRRKKRWLKQCFQEIHHLLVEIIVVISLFYGLLTILTFLFLSLLLYFWVLPISLSLFTILPTFITFKSLFYFPILLWVLRSMHPFENSCRYSFFIGWIIWVQSWLSICSTLFSKFSSFNCKVSSSLDNDCCFD